MSQNINVIKRFLAILLLSLSFLLMPSPAHGTWDSDNDRGEIRENVLERIKNHRELLNELRTERRERIASFEAKFSEARKENIRKYFRVMVRRMEAAIARLEKLMGRIDARIASLKGEGKDVSSLESDVTEARGLIANVKILLSEAKANLETVLSSGDPKEQFKTVKASLKEVKDTLKTVHRLLVRVVVGIAQLEGYKGVSVTLTPTPTPEASPSPTL